MLNKGLSKKHILFILATFCGYIVYALYFTGFGANAPVMMKHYSITSAEQGFILTMQSTGALVMAVFLAFFGERLNKIFCSGLGVFLAGFACIAIGFTPSYIVLLLLVAAAGASFTSLDVMSNSMISEVYPKQKSTIIPLLQAFFGTGAIISPILVATLVNPDIPSTYTRPFLLAGLLAIAVATIFCIMGRRILPETPYADMETVKKRTSENPAEIFKDRKAWIILIAGFLYFSFSSGILSWLPSYYLEVGMDFRTSGSMLTTFFTGSLVMRFCGPFILKKITVYKAYILSSLFSTVAIFAALLVSNMIVLIPLLVIGGFMQGSCVAFLFLMAVDAFPHRSASASSLVVIALNIGAMTAPLWMGFLAEFTGYRVPLLLGCLLLPISVVFVFMIQKKD